MVVLEVRTLRLELSEGVCGHLVEGERVLAHDQDDVSIDGVVSTAREMAQARDILGDAGDCRLLRVSRGRSGAAVPGLLSARG